MDHPSRLAGVPQQSVAKEVGILDNLKELAAEAVRWNTQSFGNVFFRRKRLLARLASIQKAMKTHSTRNLCRL